MLPLNFSNIWGYLEVAILVSNEEQLRLCVHIIILNMCVHVYVRKWAGTHFMYIPVIVSE